MSTQLVLASDSLSTRLGVEKGHMLSTIKAQCFKNTRPENVSDTQLAAYVQVAQSLGLNPLLPGMLYAYPERNGGIQPIIGPDGVFKILAENPNVDSWESTVYPEDPTQPPTHATARIWVKGSQHPRTFTAYFAEWCMDSNPNWKARPRHMIWTRALKQCARQVIHGIPFDSDEHAIAQRNGDAEPVNVTGTGDEAPAPAPERPKAPARRGSARAAAEAAQAADPITPAAQPSSPAPAASAQVEVVREETSQPVPQATTAPAGEVPAKKAEPIPVKEEAPAAPKVPEILPGIGIDGFQGAAWPLDLVIEIKEVKQLALTPQKTPVAVFTGHIQGQPDDQILQFVTLEGVGIDGSGKPKLIGETLAAGKKIAANVYARLRAGKTDVAPVLWAAKLATSEEF
jgi:hypothetical protein